MPGPPSAIMGCMALIVVAALRPPFQAIGPHPLRLIGTATQNK